MSQEVSPSAHGNDENDANAVNHASIPPRRQPEEPNTSRKPSGGSLVLEDYSGESEDENNEAQEMTHPPLTQMPSSQPEEDETSNVAMEEDTENPSPIKTTIRELLDKDTPKQNSKSVGGLRPIPSFKSSIYMGEEDDDDENSHESPLGSQVRQDFAFDSDDSDDYDDEDRVNRTLQKELLTQQNMRRNDNDTDSEIDHLDEEMVNDK
jgi:hypothetical protein